MHDFRCVHNPAEYLLSLSASIHARARVRVCVCMKQVENSSMDFMKSGAEDFYNKLSHHFNFHLDWLILTITLHKDLHAILQISPQD
jgi:hypothetical protein